MRESESSIYEHAEHGTGDSHTACQQLVSKRPRYSLWVSRHEREMKAIAKAKLRERQITRLRGLAVGQIHRAALVRHLRANEITGKDRDLLLQEFFGPRDAECAILTEHRNYILAASSQVCAVDLLDLTGDRYGIKLVSRYQEEFGLFFAMYCDRARAQHYGRPYLLEGLIPEIRDEATRIRQMLMGGNGLPIRTRP